MAFLMPLISFTACSDDEDVEDGADSNEKYLASIEIKEHEYKFGKPSSYGVDYESYTFDRDGKLLKRMTNYYSPIAGGRLQFDYDYIYDSENRLVETNEYRISLFYFKYM